MTEKNIANLAGDTELITEVLAGNKERYGILIERYCPMAFALAISKIEDPTEAEDVVQESFIQAYIHLSQLRKPDCFAGWLIKIVGQKCVDSIRKRVRVKQVSMAGINEPATGEPFQMSTNPGLTQPQKRFIRTAVARLPEKFRKVIIMRFIGGFSTQEVARQLGKRPVTVRVWLHRSYGRLKKELGPLLAEVRNGEL